MNLCVSQVKVVTQKRKAKQLPLKRNSTYYRALTKTRGLTFPCLNNSDYNMNCEYNTQKTITSLKKLQISVGQWGTQGRHKREKIQVSRTKKTLYAKQFTVFGKLFILHHDTVYFQIL
jgi:hypothetical protein